jgi:hypothetical protein
MDFFLLSYNFLNAAGRVRPITKTVAGFGIYLKIHIPGSLG